MPMGNTVKFSIADVALTLVMKNTSFTKIFTT